MLDVNSEENMLMSAISLQKKINEILVETLNISTTENITAMVQAMCIPQFEVLNNLKTEALKRNYLSPLKAEKKAILNLQNIIKE